MLELGQDRKIAALIASVCVHFFLEVYMTEFMNVAYNEARKAYKSGNCPVGAVIVRNGKIISKSHNKKNSLNISVYHAEIIAIIRACKKLKRWILDDCEMYVTLEPCAMCLNAIGETRIRKIYYLASSEYEKNLCANVNKISLKKLNDVNGYETMLSNFFKEIR